MKYYNPDWQDGDLKKVCKCKRIFSYLFHLSVLSSKWIHTFFDEPPSLISGWSREYLFTRGQTPFTLIVTKYVTLPEITKSSITEPCQDLYHIFEIPLTLQADFSRFKIVEERPLLHVFLLNSSYFSRADNKTHRQLAVVVHCDRFGVDQHLTIRLLYTLSQALKFA